MHGKLVTHEEVASGLGFNSADALREWMAADCPIGECANPNCGSPAFWPEHEGPCKKCGCRVVVTYRADSPSDLKAKAEAAATPKPSDADLLNALRNAVNLWRGQHGVDGDDDEIRLLGVYLSGRCAVRDSLAKIKAEYGNPPGDAA